MEYFMCKKHGKLPVKEFQPFDLKLRRRRCKKCYLKLNNQHKTSFFTNKDKPTYEKSIRIRKSMNVKNLSQTEIYDIITKFNDRCPLTNKTHGCTIARWRTSTWDSKRTVFLCKAYAEALESAVANSDMAEESIRKPVIIAAARSRLSKEIESGRGGIEKHLTRWMLSGNCAGMPDTAFTDALVPELIFSADAVKQIDDMLSHSESGDDDGDDDGDGEGDGDDDDEDTNKNSSEAEAEAKSD